MERLLTAEVSATVIPEAVPPAAGRTALELLARPVEDYMTFDDSTPGPRPFVSTPTQQRTFDQQAQRPDTVPDISQE